MLNRIDWFTILDKHCYETLRQIYVEPPPDIVWIDIQNLLEKVAEKLRNEGVEAKVKSIPGDPVIIHLDGAPQGIVPEPDPAKRTARRNIQKVREILRYVGVIP
ncbi:MAG TPA: hypothetical protein VJ761_15015 [Ktedonobacteraceae bacterium]|nr:hypothetical protein [Ktedonobacteraceae bacterium]